MDNQRQDILRAQGLADRRVVKTRNSPAAKDDNIDSSDQIDGSCVQKRRRLSTKSREITTKHAKKSKILRKRLSAADYAYLVGTIHVNDENNLRYQVLRVEIDDDNYIVAVRASICDDGQYMHLTKSPFLPKV